MATPESNPLDAAGPLEPSQPLAVATGSAITCANCGAEMTYNVPRLGPAGGYVHKETGRLDCMRLFRVPLVICRDCWNCFGVVEVEPRSFTERCPHCNAYDPHGSPPQNPADEPRAAKTTDSK